MTCRAAVRGALFGLCLVATAAAAQTPGVDVPPLPAAPRTISMPSLHDMRLANGLRVVLAPRDQWPLVSATLLVRSGPEADPAGRAGLAATTATLLGKGAMRAGHPTGASTLARQAEALGGALEVASTWQASTIGMSVTVPKLEQALALMADVSRRPLFNNDELDRVRAQAQGDLRIVLNDPAEVAMLAARRAFWADTRYAATPTAASLGRLTLAQVKAFHARWYRPDNAVLVLVGAIDAEHAEQLAKAWFGDWRTPTVALPVLPSPHTGRNDARLVLIDMPGSGQSSVVLALPFGALSAEQRPVAQVANAVLGLGYSARLNQEVRIRRGLSYGASSGLDIHPDASLLSAQALTQNSTAAHVLELLRGEVRQMAEQLASADELAARQATLVGAFARQLDTVGSLNRLIVTHLAQDRPLHALGQAIDEITAVTAQQVREFAQRHWPPARVRAVMVGDTQAGGAALRELDPQARPIPLAKLDLQSSTLMPPVR
jgi:zinc protease